MRLTIYNGNGKVKKQNNEKSKTKSKIHVSDQICSNHSKILNTLCTTPKAMKIKGKYYEQ